MYLFSPLLLTGRCRSNAVLQCWRITCAPRASTWPKIKNPVILYSATPARPRLQRCVRMKITGKERWSEIIHNVHQKCPSNESFRITSPCGLPVRRQMIDESCGVLMCVRVCVRVCICVCMCTVSRMKHVTPGRTGDCYCQIL